MTKREIAKELANRSNLTPSQATHAVEGIVEIIADALAKDEPILLRGFGTINERETAAYTAITSQHAQAVRDYRSKVYEGKLDALVDEGFSTVEIRDLMNKSGSSGRIRELIDCKNETLNGFLELIGVKRANTKRERMITDEVGANNSLLKLNIRDMFESRKKGLEEVERVFGISGKVICNVDLDDDGNMTEEKGGVENE